MSAPRARRPARAQDPELKAMTTILRALVALEQTHGEALPKRVLDWAVDRFGGHIVWRPVEPTDVE